MTYTQNAERTEQSCNSDDMTVSCFGCLFKKFLAAIL